MRRILLAGALLLPGCLSDAEAFKDSSNHRGRGGAGSAGGVLPIELPDIAGRYGVLCTGQSRGCGTSGSASTVVTNTQPYDNGRASGTTSPFPDLIETTNETILSSMINQLTSQVASQTDLVATARFADGTRWDEIDSGSTTFNNILAQADDAETVDPALRWAAVVVSIGESDGAAGTTGTAYKATGHQYRLDLEAALSSRGVLAPGGLAMFLEQTPAWTAYQADPTIPLAQLEMHNARDHRTFLLPIQNYGTFTDGAHNTAQGKQDVGTRFGTPLASLFLPNAYEWEPLQPRSTIADGNFVRMYYITPCARYPSGSRCAEPKLAFDSTIVSTRDFPYFIGNNATGDTFSVYASEGIYKGMRYEDPNVNGIRPRIITGPTIVASASCSECAADETRIDIELSSPARTGSYIGVSDISQSGTSVGCDPSHGLGAGCEASSNLRDTDTTSPWTGSAAGYRFAAVSRQAITGAVDATQLTQIANDTSVSYAAGTNYFDVADAAALDFTTTFSWFVLINFSTQVTNNIILARVTGAAGPFAIKQAATDEITWQFSTTSLGTVTSAANLSTGATYCLAGSYDGGRTAGVDRARIYVGRPGVSWSKPTQNATGAGAPATMIADTIPLRFGHVSSNVAINGRDNDTIWNVALTSSQLRAYCNSFTSNGALVGDVLNTADLPDPLMLFDHEGDTGTTVVNKASPGTLNATTHGTVTRGVELTL